MARPLTFSVLMGSFLLGAAIYIHIREKIARIRKSFLLILPSMVYTNPFPTFNKVRAAHESKP